MTNAKLILKKNNHPSSIKTLTVNMFDMYGSSFAMAAPDDLS